MLNTIILKPTRECNANCDYCCSPNLESSIKWSFKKFKEYFNNINPLLTKNADFIWHGGEPMLMEPDFYTQCYDFVKKTKPGIKFSMQTNILLYNKHRWKTLLKNVFEGRISTSYDPDNKHRKLNNDSNLYKKAFFSKLNQMLDDGFDPLVIGTYTDENISSAYDAYQLALDYAQKGKSIHLRYNYRFPLGRSSGKGEMLSPKRYGDVLVGLYDKWIANTPDFTIIPMVQLLAKVIGYEDIRCPWVSNCTGRILGIEPNGDVYNCPDFADLEKAEYCFGNLNNNSIDEIFKTDVAINFRRRPFNLSSDCKVCEHLKECMGGCMRDSVLFSKNLFEKTYYCEAWIIIIRRIKESIETGEADNAINKYIKSNSQNQYNGKAIDNIY